MWDHDGLTCTLAILTSNELIRKAVKGTALININTVCHSLGHSVLALRKMEVARPLQTAFESKEQWFRLREGFWAWKTSSGSQPRLPMASAWSLKGYCSWDSVLETRNFIDLSCLQMSSQVLAFVLLKVCSVGQLAPASPGSLLPTIISGSGPLPLPLTPAPAPLSQSADPNKCSKCEHSHVELTVRGSAATGQCFSPGRQT